MKRVVVLASVMTVLLAACSSLQRAAPAPHAVEARIDLPYHDDNIRKHRLDLYYPRDARERWPVVVFVHGGFWSSGDKSYLEAFTGLYGNVGVALAGAGIGAVITNYRLLPEATLDDMLDDVAGAVQWARARVEELGGDPTRIVLAGHSAGAHLVTLLGMNPALLTARGVDAVGIVGVVGISGVYDVEQTIPLVSDALRTRVFLPLFSADPAAQREASPLTHAGAHMTPTLFLVGKPDYRSCERDYVAAEEKLRPHLGTRAWFHRIEGNTHEDMVLEIGTARDEVTPRIVSFVRALGAPTPAVP